MNKHTIMPLDLRRGQNTALPFHRLTVANSDSGAPFVFMCNSAILASTMFKLAGSTVFPVESAITDKVITLYILSQRYGFYETIKDIPTPELERMDSALSDSGQIIYFKDIWNTSYFTEFELMEALNICFNHDLIVTSLTHSTLQLPLLIAWLTSGAFFIPVFPHSDYCLRSWRSTRRDRLNVSADYTTDLYSLMGKLDRRDSMMKQRIAPYIYHEKGDFESFMCSLRYIKAGGCGLKYVLTAGAVREAIVSLYPERTYSQNGHVVDLKRNA